MVRIFRYTLGACAFAYIGIYATLAVLRLRYPFELEWMEGGSIEHVARILAGKPLYVNPTAEFVPFIYPPLYFYLSALVAKLTGAGFEPLRLVSFASSLVTHGIILLWVRRETKSWTAGLAAAGLFAATYRRSGAWFDIARVDSLFLVLLLGALYVVRFHETRRAGVIAGILVSLAFLTKQVALLIALPVMLGSALMRRLRSISFAASALLLAGVSHFALDRIYGGLYGYYTIDLPRRHAIVKTYLLSFWTNDLALPLSIALLLSVLYLYLLRARGERSRYCFYLAAAVGMIGGAYLAKVHLGSYSNVLFPAYAIVAILFGLGLHEARELTRREPLSRIPFAEAALYLACIIQFASLVYDPVKQLPSPEDLRAGRAFIETLSRIEGDCFVPFHPYYATMAGKRSSAHHMAMRDVLRGGECPERRNLVNDIEERIRNRSYGAIVLDTDDWDFIGEIEGRYQGPEIIFRDDSVFYPVTGTRLRPDRLWTAPTAL